LCLFFGIAVLLLVKRHSSGRTTFQGEDHYRVILNIGDNFGDFDDASRGSEAERQAAFEANRHRWGREWIVIANPTYGSFDTAPFGHDFKKSREEQRKAKHDSLQSWSGPKQ